MVLPATSPMGALLRSIWLCPHDPVTDPGSVPVKAGWLSIGLLPPALPALMKLL
ncbi:hypothetical protein D3C87_1996590 [compost metagenome]